MTQYTIQGYVDGMWAREHVGANESNAFDSREEAEAELPRLAEVLGCEVSELRVVGIAVAQTQMAGRVHVVSPRPERTWCGLDAAKRGRRLAPTSFSWEHPEICGSCYRRAEEAQIRDARKAEQRHERRHGTGVTWNKTSDRLLKSCGSTAGPTRRPEIVALVRAGAFDPPVIVVHGSPRPRYASVDTCALCNALPGEACRHVITGQPLDCTHLQP